MAAAHGPAQAPTPEPGQLAERPEPWCLVLAWGKQHGQRPPRADAYSLALLGPGCATCAPVVNPQPKPKPPPPGRSATSSARTNRTGRPARGLAPTGARHRSAGTDRAAVAAYVLGGRRHLPVAQPPTDPAAAQRRAIVAAAPPRLSPAERERYNREALARLGIAPGRAPHLTGGR